MEPGHSVDKNISRTSVIARNCLETRFQLPRPPIVAILITNGRFYTMVKVIGTFNGDYPDSHGAARSSNIHGDVHENENRRRKIFSAPMINRLRWELLNRLPRFEEYT